MARKRLNRRSGRRHFVATAKRQRRIQPALSSSTSQMMRGGIRL